jgi:PAS domain S-box-containing protein
MSDGSASDSPAADLLALVRENEALRLELSRLRPPPGPPAHPELTSELEARRRMYEHFTVAPFPVAAFVGPEHVIDFANPMALRAWGKDRSVIKLPVLAALPELRDQPFVGYLDGVRATGIPYRGFSELARLARAPGGALEDAYYDFVYSPMCQRDGTIDGILMFAFEVTEQVAAHEARVRLEEETRLAAQSFRELVDNLPDLAWTTTATGKIDFFNRRWYEYTGTSPADLERAGTIALEHPQTIDAVRERWAKGIESEQAFELECPLRGRDGVFRWFLTRVRPLHEASGRITRWIGTNTDIDDRKREEGFRETILGILGHDLRNPLSAILTTARLMAKRDPGKPPNPAQVERIVRSGERMHRIIEQLLDLTRARIAGGIPVQRSPEPLALAPIVGRIVDEIRGAHPERTIDYHFDEGCAVRLDPDRFEQVVSNLVGNAVLHGDPQGRVTVVLESEQPSAQVSLHVHNDGEPIDAGILPLLFNPFAVTTSRRAGAGAGLGLGLYISERVVAAHGGVVKVRSTAHEGTRFTVSLPKA